MPNLEDQIRDIEAELAKTLYNKATQHHIGKLKAKLARLKDEQETRRSKGGGGGPRDAVKKSGNATVGLVGFPSVGKSTLLNAITDAVSAVAAYHFTTLEVIPGLLELEGAKIQVLDMPGLIRGASKGRGRGREVISVARNCDLVLLMIDVFETNVDVLVEELQTAGIRLNERPADVVVTKSSRGGVIVNATSKLTHMTVDQIRDIVREWHVNADVVVREDITPDRLIDVLAGNRSFLRAIVVLNKVDLVDKAYLAELTRRHSKWKVVAISAEKGTNLDLLRRELYDALEFMRVYLKPQGKEADLKEPLIVKGGSTVGHVCDTLHREFRKKFRYANVWGRSAKFPGQTVGLDHVVRDGDILTVVVRRR